MTLVNSFFHSGVSNMICENDSLKWIAIEPMRNGKGRLSKKPKNLYLTHNQLT